MVRPLPLPDVTHIAIFRDELGAVTRRALIFLPLAGDDEALMAAKGMKQVRDTYVDVFELHGTHRCGGWEFRMEGTV